MLCFPQGKRVSEVFRSCEIMKYIVRFVEWTAYAAGLIEANSPEEAQVIVEQALCEGKTDGFDIVVKDCGFEEWEIKELGNG